MKKLLSALVVTSVAIAVLAGTAEAKPKHSNGFSAPSGDLQRDFWDVTKLGG